MARIKRFDPAGLVHRGSDTRSIGKQYFFIPSGFMRVVGY